MYDLLCKFENLITLKTIIGYVDLNFLCKENLDEIADIAYELNIDLNHLDYDKIEYNSQYDLIEQVYFEWFEDINTMYLDVKNGLLKLI